MFVAVGDARGKFWELFTSWHGNAWLLLNQLKSLIEFTQNLISFERDSFLENKLIS